MVQNKMTWVQRQQDIGNDTGTAKLHQLHLIGKAWRAAKEAHSNSASTIAVRISSGTASGSAAKEYSGYSRVDVVQG